jgi:hypothetical protein
MDDGRKVYTAGFGSKGWILRSLDASGGLLEDVKGQHEATDIC